PRPAPGHLEAAVATVIATPKGALTRTSPSTNTPYPSGQEIRLRRPKEFRPAFDRTAHNFPLPSLQGNKFEGHDNRRQQQQDQLALDAQCSMHLEKGSGFGLR